MSFPYTGLLISEETIGSCVQLRMFSESSEGCEFPVNVNAVRFWKNSSRANRGAALFAVRTPFVWPWLPNWNFTLRTMQDASTAVSSKTMLPQSPVCGVEASVGVVSPAMASSRREVKKMRPAPLSDPTRFRAPWTSKTVKLPLGLKTTCGSTVSVTPLATVI